jgi:hypothetical protein
VNVVEKCLRIELVIVVVANVLKIWLTGFVQNSVFLFSKILEISHSLI